MQAKQLSSVPMFQIELVLPMLCAIWLLGDFFPVINPISQHAMNVQHTQCQISEVFSTIFNFYWVSLSIKHKKSEAKTLASCGVWWTTLSSLRYIFYSYCYDFHNLITFFFSQLFFFYAILIHIDPYRVSFSLLSTVKKFKYTLTSATAKSGNEKFCNLRIRRTCSSSIFICKSDFFSVCLGVFFLYFLSNKSFRSNSHQLLWGFSRLVTVCISRPHGSRFKLLLPWTTALLTHSTSGRADKTLTRTTSCSVVCNDVASTREWQKRANVPAWRARESVSFSVCCAFSREDFHS